MAKKKLSVSCLPTMKQLLGFVTKMVNTVDHLVAKEELVDTQTRAKRLIRPVTITTFVGRYIVSEIITINDIIVI